MPPPTRADLEDVAADIALYLYRMWSRMPEATAGLDGAAEDIRFVLLDLQQAGIEPELVVTDGSSLYPKVIREVWPQADHQLCVFHFIMGTNTKLGKVFWAAYKPTRRCQSPRSVSEGGRRSVGGPGSTRSSEPIETRSGRYATSCSSAGGPMLRASPGSPTTSNASWTRPFASARLSRRFVEALYELFGPTTDSHALAEERRQRIISDPEFLQFAELGPVHKSLRDDQLFTRLTRYLSFENADKTSNHVERENREFRRRQQSHYRLRSVESLCALRVPRSDAGSSPPPDHSTTPAEARTTRG